MWSSGNHCSTGCWMRIKQKDAQAAGRLCIAQFNDSGVAFGLRLVCLRMHRQMPALTKREICSRLGPFKSAVDLCRGRLL